MEYGYNPTMDYRDPYNAVQARVGKNFGAQRADLSSFIKNSGVHTGGTSSIPEALYAPAEAGAHAGVTGDFASGQAGTQNEDILRRQNFQNQQNLAQYGWDYQNALGRRLAGNQLLAGEIAGGLGLAGSMASSYAPAPQYGGSNGYMGSGSLNLPRPWETRQ